MVKVVSVRGEAIRHSIGSYYLSACACSKYLSSKAY